ncbi:MAG: hypothetical protein V4850_29345 [Myxococcota bacterium]
MRRLSLLRVLFAWVLFALGVSLSLGACGRPAGASCAACSPLSAEYVAATLDAADDAPSGVRATLLVLPYVGDTILS